MAEIATPDGTVRTVRTAAALHAVLDDTITRDMGGMVARTLDLPQHLLPALLRRDDAEPEAQ